MRPRSRARLLLALISSLLVWSLLAPPGAQARNRPALRLLVPSHHQTLYSYGHNRVGLSFGTYVGVTGGSFQVDVQRNGYKNEPYADWILNDGRAIRLPSWVVDDWAGLKGFFRLIVRTTDGRVKVDRRITFCPDSWDGQRIDDSGPLLQTYPQYCSFNPFTMSSVWGIDRGWGTAALGYGATAQLKKGLYRVTLKIRAPYRRLFGIANDVARVHVLARVREGGCCYGRVAPRVMSERRTLTPAPRVVSPDKGSLPDLVPLPAFDIGITSRKKGDWLSFAANVYNAGPSPLVVEGFRDPGDRFMPASQYFMRRGVLTGRARVGFLGYDTRQGHQHWHFEQFARYRLLDAHRDATVRSHKQSFCIAPTDPIDMLAPSAVWRPDATGLTSTCGYEQSLWIRETMPAGWGDTYYQYVGGQAFNITDLPNGRYYIEVIANPGQRLFERRTDNNTRLRLVFLKGRPGHRRVVVPDWQGIEG